MADTGPEKLKFQAEVAKLLDIVVHSLYSNAEIFLRELISNASDACDKLRYEALTRPELLEGDSGFKIALSIDKEARKLVIADNGIGMNHEDLVQNLGTIAHSGTAQFMANLSGEARKDSALIGQFGVGFYSAFMVAHKVEVVSRKAGETQAYRWESEGAGEFTVTEDSRDHHGTTITLSLRDGQDEFLEEARIRRIVKTYSDHIAIPVVLKDGDKEDTVNAASALWTRPKSEITAEQYKEFYHHSAHAFDEPWATLHYRAEGVIEYTALLFIPSSAPFDLFHPERKQHLRLYVKRVFITDDCAELLPSYLRFLRGVVDSEDLPLNVSREMLQNNPTLAKIRHGLVKRVLSELEKKAKDAETYAPFWAAFGAVLKEGVYEDFENREKLLELCRFRTTGGGEALLSLDAYVERMKPGQEAIYYITGENAQALLKSPQLEAFRAKGIDVLLLTDPVDDFWVPSVGSFKGKAFHSVTRGGVDLDKIEAEDKQPEDKPEEADTGALVAAFKLALGEAVKDVRASHRLTESAVCLVADENDLDMRLGRILRQHKQLDSELPRVLEINPGHALIRKLADRAAANAQDPTLADAALLLFDQARISEGEPVADPAAFARRLTAAIAKGLA